MHKSKPKPRSETSGAAEDRTAPAGETGILTDLFMRSRYAEVEERARALLERYPAWVQGWNILGAACGKQEKFEAALPAFERVLSLHPNDPHIYNNLGPVLQELGRLPEAIASFRKAVELKPDLAMAHMNLGIALRKQGLHAEAVESLRKAIELNPDYAEACVSLGSLYQDLGKMDEARRLLEKAVALKGSDAVALRNYSACRKFTEKDRTETERLESLLARAATDEDRYNLHFALGKIYDDIGLYDDAFRHYQEGNRIERKKYSYDPDGFSSYVDRLIEAFPPGYRQSVGETGSSSELPLFIVGMPRSGTTLTEQIISSHPLVCGAGELEHIGTMTVDLAEKQNIPYPRRILALSPADFRALAETYVGHLRRFSSDAVRVTDKMPCNYLHLGFITLLFPRAKVIHCTRNPLDTCLSIFFQRFSELHPYSTDLGDLGRYYRDYERLMRHWKRVLPPGNLMDVAYEDLIADPEGISRGMIEFCGLEWNDRCLAFYRNERAVTTPSSWQVRQPIYTTSRDRWKKYEKHLAPLEKVLSEAAAPSREAERLIRSALRRYTANDEVEAALARILRSEKDIFDALRMLGSREENRGNYADAEKLFRHAVTVNDHSAAAFHNLALILQKQGKLDEAVDNYQRAVALKPDFAAAYENYAGCRQWSVGDKPLADRLEELLRSAGNAEDRCSYHFALGKMYGDFGIYDESFRHYQQGNLIERGKYSYDRRIFTSYVDRMQRTFSAGRFAERRGAGATSNLPVFIIGMPRSGTTLVEQIVASHPEAHGAGELKHINAKITGIEKALNRPYPECMEIATPEILGKTANEYLELLRRANPNAVRITDKMPHNFLHLGLISLLLPGAKVIHCRRNPPDTCLSIYFQRFYANLHPYSYDLTDLGYYYRDYERLMEHWNAVLPRGMMLEVGYEQLVDRPEETSRAIMEFCGLEWDEQCLMFHQNRRAVKTASSWQVRQPLYTTSKEKWRRYEQHLAPLLAALSWPRM